MTVFYKFDGKLYANITNRCPCSCEFCIRNNSDSIADNDSLWLEHEPDYDEIIAAFEDFDKTGLNELVFCGYGEPMERAELLLSVAEYVKGRSQMKIRINTNGLLSFINPSFDIYSLKGVVDSISISLNASTPERYLMLTRSKFGLPSYNAMLNFAIITASIVPNVCFTIVDYNMDEDEREACIDRAGGMGIPVKFRHYVSDNAEYK